jgi:tRNA (guanine37-N1)-methyltransferase
VKIDIVTIFPDYFQALGLSLMGKAADKNLLEIAVHDLRDATNDPHRSVDDTPYGGGAGMVMMPEPWGVVLDQLLTPQSILLVPSPAGALFSQSMASELSHSGHLVFACGRYEGIDYRVIEHYRTTHTVLEVSVGDYVLNGGEVAALVMVEAIARLIPGVLGNPESLVEESHQNGLLEYPSYTKPRSWRGLEVPEVLLSGNHAAIRKWRAEQSLAKTSAVRPELLGD